MFAIIWYRAKVLRVLKDDFGYEPSVPGWQSEIFNGVTRQLKKLGGNEYDGAVAFMLVQARSLTGDNVEKRAFIHKVETVADALMPRTKLGASLR